MAMILFSISVKKNKFYFFHYKVRYDCCCCWSCPVSDVFWNVINNNILFMIMIMMMIYVSARARIYNVNVIELQINYKSIINRFRIVSECILI